MMENTTSLKKLKLRVFDLYIYYNIIYIMNFTNQITFTISHIRNGLRLTTTLSSILNNDNRKVNDFFNKLFDDKPDHHIDYLKSKMYISHHSNTFSGGLYITYKNMPEDDRMKIINQLDNYIDMKSLEVTLWFIRWSFGKMGYSWMMDVLDLKDTNLEKEWNTYKETDLDTYFMNLNDHKLQKYIDDINKMRFEYPSIDEVCHLHKYVYL